MFNVLNRFISVLDSDAPGQNSHQHHGQFGFQVLKNKDPNLPIEPWFDFIVGINGRQIDDPEPHLFAQEIRNCAGGSVTLGIWSAKGQRIRTLLVSVPSDTASLGLTLQWTSLSTTEDVWHILDVAPNSPAEQAGLLPHGDYIIGTPEGIVRGEAGLGELVEDHLSRPLDLHIYNQEYDVTRLVTITPSRHWGGSGALGCVLGYGALHRLPAPLDEPPQAPGETLFETARFSNEDDAADASAYGRGSGPASQGGDAAASGSRPETTGGGGTATGGGSDFLVPAQQFSSIAGPPSFEHGAFSSPSGTSAPPPPPPAAAAAAAPPHKAPGRRPRTHGLSPNRAMDEYFREGEEKSREVDHAPTGRAGAGPAGGGGLPPPPRKGEAPPVVTQTDGSGSAPGSRRGSLTAEDDGGEKEEE